MKSSERRSDSAGSRASRLLAWWLMGLVLATPAAMAQTSWKGTSSTSWNTAANWSAGVPSATVDAIIGDASFTGINQPTISANATCRSLTLGAGSKSSTLTVSRALTVLGNISIGANGRLAHTSTSSSRTISLTGNWTNSGTYTASSSSCGVTFSGVAQSLGGGAATGFRRLTINVGSTVTLGHNISATNTLSVSGTLDPGAGSGFVVAGPGALSVASGGKLVVRATTFAGNYTISGTKTLSAGNTVDYAASGNQTVSNLPYSTLRISGSGVKTLSGNLPALVSSSATAGNLEVAAGLLDLSTFTASRGTTVTGGTISVAAGATLRIGGTGTFPANFATHALNSTGTVEYAGANQTVAAENYGNLTLSGSSGAVTKTMPASALSVAGHLTASTGTAASVSFTAGAALTVNGSVVLGANTLFNGGAFSHAIGGNWTNAGTFTASSGTVTMNGVNTVLAGAGANNFFHLTIARSGIMADANTSLNVAGHLATTGAGTFTHTPGGAGTVTMSGAGKTIGGTGIRFNRLSVAGSISTASSFTVADHLTVNGSLAASSGIITLSGAGKTISGSGTLAFHALDVPGSISTTNSLSLAGNLSVDGSFTATAGMATFAGSTIFHGTASLFNTTLNGTLLRMSADSILRLAGATTLTAGSFDVTNQRPNTVVYNSGGSQSVYPITYDNLEIAAGGTKTAAGRISVRGDFRIDAGAVFSGGTGGYTNYVRHHWLNYGTFEAGNGAVEMVGPNDSIMDGATIFNLLRVNKDTSALLVNLLTNQTAATLDLALGTMDTGAGALTITSTRTGNGHVFGTITRRHDFAAGVDYAFEGPLTTVRFASLTSVSSVTMTATSGAISDFPSGAAISRQYTVSLASGGAYNATLRASYQETEVNGNDEAEMALWRAAGSDWALSGKSGHDAANDWVEQSGLTDISGRWTMAAQSGVVRWDGSISADWDTAANWTIVEGSPARPPSTNDIAELGTMTATYQPTITSAAKAKSISFGSAQAMTLTLSPGGELAASGIQAVGNVGGIWTNDVDHTIDVGAQTMSVGGNLTLSDGTTNHTINLRIGSGAVAVGDNLIQSGGAGITFTGDGRLSIGGDFHYTSGAFTPGSGTVHYTGSGAQVIGAVPYHHLTFSKPAGVATLPSAAGVAGNLTLTNGARVRLGAALAVAGRVMIHTNTTLDLGGSTLSVGGDWVCGEGGVLNVSSGGEVAFNGSGAQSIGSCRFHDLVIAKSSGTATLAGNISFNADVGVRSGTLDLSIFTLTPESAGAILTLEAGARLRTAGEAFGGFASILLDPASTVEYYAPESQIVSVATYGHLVLTNGGGHPKTLAGPVTVAGNLHIDGTATLSASSNSLTLYGSWTNHGAFSGGTGTVVLNGTNKTVAGATTFNHLTVPGSYLAANCDIGIAGNVTILGSYIASNGTTTLDGDLNNTGTLLNYGTLTFTGTRVQDFVLNAGFLNRGTVNFNGSVRPVLHSTTRPQHQIVNINNTAGVLLGVGWDVYGSLSIQEGASWDGSIYSHMFYGTVTNNGVMTGSGGFTFSPSNNTTLALGTSFTNSGTVTFGGTRQITISGGALAFNFVEVANTHAAGLTPASDWTLAGNLSIDNGAVFHAGAGLTHTIGGDFHNDGILDGGTSLVVFNGASEIQGVGSTVFANLLVSGSLTDLAPISVTGNFTNNGVFDAAGEIVTFSGSTPSLLSGSTSPTTIDSLVIAKSAAAVTLGVNVTGLTALTISDGTLDLGAYSLSQNSADGGALIVGASGTLKLGGGNSFPVFGHGVTLDPASTVNYSGAGQTVAAITYANLTLSGSGDKTLTATTTVNGNLEIRDTAKFNLTYASGSFSPVGSLTFGDGLQVAGTWGSSSSTADHQTELYFQGAGKLNVGNRSLDHFAVTTPGAQTAGTAFAIATITAQDANNNTVASFAGTVDLTETGDGVGGTASPSLSGAFTAGVLSGQIVTLTKAGAAVTVTVADHAGTLKSGSSGAIAVSPGALHHYAVTFSPPPFYANVPFSTVVTAQDANTNTVTTDSSNAVTVSCSSLNMGWDATGVGEFSPGLTPEEAYHITKTLTNGVAIFSTRDSVAETGVAVTAATASPAVTGTSAAIDVQARTGAYRSKASGNWGDAGTWERFAGSAWENAAVAPASSDEAVMIRDSHVVTIAASVTVDQVYLQSGGRINVSGGVTLTIGSASSPGLEVSGILNNAGVLTFQDNNHSFVWPGGVLESSGMVHSTFETLEFKPGSPGGKYRHLFAAAAGTIPTAEWEDGSVCEITGYTSNTDPPTGLGQAFHGLAWNCPGQSASIALGSELTAVGGDFTVTDTGLGALTLGADLAVAGTLRVDADARLNCATKTVSGAEFTLGSGGTLGIGSADGITSSGADGNIQTITRACSTDGNYIYNGITAQSVGNGLPATVFSLAIENAAGEVTLARPVAASGGVTLAAGARINLSSATPGGPTLTAALLTVDGGVTVLVPSSLVEVAEFREYPLMHSEIRSGPGEFALGTLPTEGVYAFLDDTGTNVTLRVNSSEPLEWNGDKSAAWDGDVANWKQKTGGAPDRKFSAGLAVEFNDALSNHPDVTVNGSVVIPKQIVFTNGAIAYSLSGTGRISGAGGLLKAGTSSVTIHTANDYAGPTEVREGSLRVENGGGSATGSGLVDVSGAGMLAGSGRVSGLRVGSGGMLSPGAGGAATLTAGTTIWATNGVYRWEVNDFSGAHESDPGRDKLVCTGVLTIAATAANAFTVRVASLTYGNASGMASNFAPISGYTQIIASAAGISGFDADKFVVDTTALSNDYAGGWSVALPGGTNLALVYSPLIMNTAATTNGLTDAAFSSRLTWSAPPNAGVLGNPNARWGSYAVFYTCDGSEPTTGSPVLMRTNGPADIGTITTTSVIISNVSFDTDVRMAIAGMDKANHYGPLSLVVTQRTAGFAMAPAAVSALSGVTIRWERRADQPCDVIYQDAPAWGDTLTNGWLLLGTSTGGFLEDTGGVSRTPPQELGAGVMRFYRVTRKDHWQTCLPVRSASREIYVARNLRVLPGESWYSLPAIPDDPTIAGIFGTNRLPAGSAPALATRISWYSGGTPGGQANRTVYLSNQNRWVYMLGGEGDADTAPVPLSEGFVIEMPAGAPAQGLLILGRLTTNNLSTTAYGGNRFNMLSYTAPNRPRVRDLGLREAGFRGAANNNQFTQPDELRVLNNTNGNGSVSSPRLRIWLKITATETNFYNVSGGNANNTLLDPDDVLIWWIRGVSDQAWTARPTDRYRVPTPQMTP